MENKRKEGKLDPLVVKTIVSIFRKAFSEWGIPQDSWRHYAKQELEELNAPSQLQEAVLSQLP